MIYDTIPNMTQFTIYAIYDTIHNILLLSKIVFQFLRLHYHAGIFGMNIILLLLLFIFINKLIYFFIFEMLSILLTNIYIYIYIYIYINIYIYI